VEASSLIDGLSARLTGVSPLSEHDTPGLLEALAGVPDPRDARGRIHPLPGLLAIAIAAVVSGSSRVVEIAVSGSSRVVEIVEWAADLPDVVWDRLGATRDAFTAARRVPDDSTLSRSPPCATPRSACSAWTAPPRSHQPCAETAETPTDPYDSSDSPNYWIPRKILVSSPTTGIQDQISTIGGGSALDI